MWKVHQKPKTFGHHPGFALKAESLYRLEEENHEAAARLEEVVYRGDVLLEKIQSALADIAQSQLKTRSSTHSQPLPDS